MTMTIDASQQRFGSYGGFDNMSPYHHQPQFTNPWSSTSTTTPQSNGLYAGSAVGMTSNPLSMDRHSQQPPASRSAPAPSASLASYSSVPVSTASAGSNLSMVAETQFGAGSQDLLSVPQDLLSLGRMTHPSSGAAYQDPAYSTSAASPVHPSYSAAQTSYDSLGYAPAPARSTYSLNSEVDPHTRRYSQSLNDDRRSFQDAIEASHGMLSMKFDTSNQETPRAGVYNSRGRGSQDSYGFPSAHSTTSSVSSTFSPYYGSVDSSVSDYSSVAGSDAESVSSRTLPRPQGLMAAQPPAASSMMGQFSSKVSTSSQKKHRCKVCDKRFTRPSSLQTHMYSHTGEKPFQCEVEGCGRHFSVVSNLRRHRKVHKGDNASETSEDHSDD